MAALSLRGIRTLLLGPLDLQIGAGEAVLISGPSGSGKSLLLRAVADLDPNEGDVLIGSDRRSDLAPARWRRRVGLLPAESGWWAERVGDHFEDAQDAGSGRSGPARPDNADSAPRPLLQLLRDLGFDPDVLDWSVDRLSTGERQRLALARMLGIGPQALLLDEPTANLDPVNRARVEAAVEDYRRRHGAAVLWVSHDPEQRRRIGGRSLVIEDRGLVEEDST